MITGAVWLIKLLIAHLLTDFVMQPASWVEDRNQKHFASWKLYWHVLLTAIVAWLLIGWSYWLVALVILGSLRSSDISLAFRLFQPGTK